MEDTLKSGSLVTGQRRSVMDNENIRGNLKLAEMSRNAHQMIVEEGGTNTHGGISMNNTNTNMSEDEALLQGFLMDMTQQSQGANGTMFAGTVNNL